jgi:hypothetical protein
MQRATTAASTASFVIEPAAQPAAGPEGWNRLRVHRYRLAGPRIMTSPGLAPLGTEGAKAPYLNPMATCQRAGDLIENRGDDPLRVFLPQMRVAGGEVRDQFRPGHLHLRFSWPISYHHKMNQDDRNELLGLTTRAFHELRQRMSEDDAVRILFNTIVLGEGEPPWPLTPDQVQRVQGILEEMRRLLAAPLLRH